MAEQNRRTKAQRQARERAELIVDLYIEHLESERHINDVAREGRSILGTYSEHGELPRGSGFSGFCKLAGKIDKVRKRIETREQLWATGIMGQIGEIQRSALFMDRTHRGRTKVAIDPFTPENPVPIHWDDRRCSDALGCSKKDFQRRVSDGYVALERLIVERVAA